MVICYKIAANEGSESGSGYNFVRELTAYVDDITVVSRKDHVAALVNDPALHGVRLVGYDLPQSVGWWKRGRRGVIPYYYLWQMGVGRLVARRHDEHPFDVVHQYNFHTDWAPHFLRARGARVVWGPICHQPALPLSYCRLEPVQGPVREAAKGAAKQLFWRLDPQLRRAVRRTDVVLYANRDVAPPFRSAADLRFQTFGGASFLGVSSRDTPKSGALSLIHVGRMVSIKGAPVALEALSHAVRELGADARLELVGDGPLRQALAASAHRLGIEKHVTFTRWLPQPELAARYAEADALLYPSLANQDTVVAEGLAAGLPILGVATTGTEFMAGDAGLAAARRPHRRTVVELASAIARLAAEKQTAPEDLVERQGRALARSNELSWAATAASVARTYAR